MAHAIEPELLRGIFIIRHGETIDNERGVLSGHRPVGLSARGMRQAQELGMLLHGIKADALYTSDLPRAVQTATIVRPCGTPLYATPLLRERHGGSITGKYREEVDWSQLPSDVESDAMLAQRAALFLHRLDGTAIIVGHEGINRMLVERITGCTPLQARAYACVSQHCGVDYFRYGRRVSKERSPLSFFIS